MNGMSTSAFPTSSFVSGSKRLLIGGEWVQAKSGKAFDSVNPATGEVIARLAQGDKADVHEAVVAARKAFEGEWSKWTPYDRQRLLIRIHDLVEKHFNELALIETLDMGAPLVRTRGYKSFVSQLILFYASQTAAGGVQTLQNSLPGRFRTFKIKAPVGVVGGIIPWNGPLISQWWILGPTLATGCTAVLKPAEDASLTALRVAELLIEAGMPPGWSMWLQATELRPAVRCRSILTSTVLPLRARRRPGVRLLRPRQPTSSASRWSWVESRPTSCSRTPTWTRPCRE